MQFGKALAKPSCDAQTDWHGAKMRDQPVIHLSGYLLQLARSQSLTILAQSLLQRLADTLKTRLVHSRFQPQLGWDRKQPQGKAALNCDQVIRCLTTYRPIDQNVRWNTSAPGQPNG